jgi:hypothetical protein
MELGSTARSTWHPRLGLLTKPLQRRFILGSWWANRGSCWLSLGQSKLRATADCSVSNLSRSGANRIYQSEETQRATRRITPPRIDKTRIISICGFASILVTPLRRPSPVFSSARESWHDAEAEQSVVQEIQGFPGLEPNYVQV